MKKSEMIVKLTRMYHIRHVMVEGGYITPQQFMEEVLEYAEHLGMMPPLNKEKSFKMLDNGELTYNEHEWEPEK